MNNKVLVSGSAGFVSAHLIEHFLKNTDWEIVGIDRLDTTSNLKRVGEVIDAHPEWKNRYKFIWWDLKSPITPSLSKEIGKVDSIFHLAASSHVDDSISNPLLYAYDNVIGTVNLLDYARQLDSLNYIQNFSTDECYGTAPIGVDYTEESRYKPRNPYSSAKSAADHFAYAYYITYHLPVVTTNCTNIYGEKQDVRKWIPMIIKKILAGEKLYIHCYPGKIKEGTRQWIHGRNVAAACLFLRENAKVGERYHIPAQTEKGNLEIAQIIANIMNMKFDYEMEDQVATRCGHDHRYSLDGTKLLSMGFKYPVEFLPSLEKTVNWYLANQSWLV